MYESEKWKSSRSVVSNFSQPHGLQPSRLLHPWDFPGKSTGVGCHCLLRDLIKRWAEDLNRNFSKDMQLGNRHVKGCSALLIIREMQLKTTMRYHFTPVRMSCIKKITNHKCWPGCGEKGALVPCWWECKLVQLLWKTIWIFLKKLKIELPYNPKIPLLGIYPKKTRTLIRKHICTLMFIAATIANIWKWHKCPSIEK